MGVWTSSVFTPRPRSYPQPVTLPVDSGLEIAAETSRQFLHVFAGDSYSAGYYSYLWSDVLTADAYQAFVEGKGPYDPEVARRLREFIFAVGNTMDPAEAYRKFRGRDPRIEALMEKRGFPVN